MQYLKTEQAGRSHKPKNVKPKQIANKCRNKRKLNQNHSENVHWSDFKREQIIT